VVKLKKFEPVDQRDLSIWPQDLNGIFPVVRNVVVYFNAVTISAKKPAIFLTLPIPCNAENVLYPLPLSNPVLVVRPTSRNFLHVNLVWILYLRVRIYVEKYCFVESILVLYNVTMGLVFKNVMNWLLFLVVVENRIQL